MEFPRPYGRYELLERIGEGGMAEVFRARLPGVAGFEKILVIKRILPHLARNKRFVQMFVNEAQLAAKLQHQNVVQVYELGQLDTGELYIAMEYVPGVDLRGILRNAAQRDLRIPIWFSVHTLAQIMGGLSHAHELCDANGNPLHVVHRDVTPSNVFVSNSGEVKLADFGIAKAAGQVSETRSGQLKGKISYMPPEQLHGQPLDARADVFAVGVVLWECLTQRRLFGGRPDFETMLAICEGKREPPSRYNPKVPPDLDALTLQALEPDRERRVESAREFQAQLLEVQSKIRARLLPNEVRHVVEVLLGQKEADPKLGADLAYDGPNRDDTRPPRSASNFDNTMPPIAPVDPRSDTDTGFRNQPTPSMDGHAPLPPLGELAPTAPRLHAPPQVPPASIPWQPSGPRPEPTLATKVGGHRFTRPPQGELTHAGYPPGGMLPSVSPYPGNTQPPYPGPGRGPTFPPPTGYPESMSQTAIPLDPSSHAHLPLIPTSLAPASHGQLPAAMPDPPSNSIIPPQPTLPPQFLQSNLPPPPEPPSVETVQGTPLPSMDDLVDPIPSLDPPIGLEAPAPNRPSDAADISGNINFYESHSSSSWSMISAYHGPHPFWIRSANGTVEGPISYEDMLKFCDPREGNSGKEISHDERSWLDIPTFGTLTGLDFLAPDTSPLSNVVMVSRLDQRSLVQMLSRLARTQRTGRLVIMESGSGKSVARREIDVVKGAPTFVYADRPELQIPALLVRREIVSQQLVPELVHQSLKKRQPLDDLLSRRAAMDVSGHRPLFMRDRLAELFKWRQGKVAFDEGTLPRVTKPFAPSLLHILVEAVHRSWKQDELVVKLEYKMARKLEKSERFDEVIGQMDLTKAQFTAARRLAEGKPLTQLLKKYQNDGTLYLIMAYILTEMDLLMVPLD